jgi:hypothetical protein
MQRKKTTKQQSNTAQELFVGHDKKAAEMKKRARKEKGAHNLVLYRLIVNVIG